MSNKNTTRIVIQENGMAKACNPFGETEPTFASTCVYDIFEKEMKECEIINWQNFEAQNKPLPYIGTATVGDVVEGELVWQWRAYDTVGEWRNSDSEITKFGVATRQAWLIVEAKHPTLDEMVKHTIDRMPGLYGLTQPEAKAIEETLKEAAGKSWEYNSKTLGEPINPIAFVLGFGAGANWQKQQRNDELTEAINDIIKYAPEFAPVLTTLLSTINKK